MRSPGPQHTLKSSSERVARGYDGLAPSRQDRSADITALTVFDSRLLTLT
ncbi:hypothetical protein SEA_WILKINS_83 [Mycobacterium phage Wilkins]|nr:hypothetical protein SEA_WILKINS_83 [Mycobacterium phage Wilkins]QOI67133.1 hypothetical protein SEA_TOPGUN_82 [Mycobacterium phage Topgun]